ncbi:MAG: hypothetical protein MCS20_01320 [Candidatus Phytoplasma mali]|nr:hypothetical protein [Candidatus Phytoplasma mali]
MCESTIAILLRYIYIYIYIYFGNTFNQYNSFFNQNNFHNTYIVIN